MDEYAANVLLVAETIAFVYVLFRTNRSLHRLDEAAANAPDTDWLLRGVRFYVRFCYWVAIYLLLMVGLGAIVGPLTVHYPLIRPLNGALLLGILSGGYWLDRGIRIHGS